MEEVIERTGEKAKVASVLLINNSLANVGISNREGIMEQMRNLLDPSPGKTVRSHIFTNPLFNNIYKLLYILISLLRVLYILLDWVLITMLIFSSQCLRKVVEYIIILTLQRR